MKNLLFTLTTVLVLFFTSSAFAGFYVIAGAGGKPVGTEITSLPVTINSSGFYYITKNLPCLAGTHGITIDVDNVTLDLMGFSLVGPGGADFYDGIYMHEKSNIEIRNGTIRNFPRNGIYGGYGVGNRINNLNINNNSFGVYLIDDISVTVTGCTTMENDNMGLYLGTSSIVKNNTAYKNGSTGIFARYGSVVTNNASFQNGYAGITVDYGSTVTGNTCYDNSDYGITASVGSTIVDNTAHSNGSGIRAGYGSTVTNNTAYGNTNNGIRLYNESYVDSNTAVGNSTNVIYCTTNCTYGQNHFPVP